MEHYDMALRIAALTPWMFLSGGPVARGRYSQQGLWYSTIVNGTNEQQLPKIMEAAYCACLPQRMLIVSAGKPERPLCQYCPSALVGWWRSGADQSSFVKGRARSSLVTTKGSGG